MADPELGQAFSMRGSMVVADPLATFADIANGLPATMAAKSIKQARQRLACSLASAPTALSAFARSAPVQRCMPVCLIVL